MATWRFISSNMTTDATTFMLVGPAVTYGSVLMCTNGAPEITRTDGGSFLVDRVRRQSLLSGTIASRFAGSKRVSTVTADTITMASNAGSSTSGPGEAGTFTPSVLSTGELTNYPIDNLLNDDRRVPFVSTSLPSAIDYDFGSNKTPTWCGALGMRGDPVIGGGLLSFVLSGSSSANGYPPVSGGSWTTLATTNTGFARDASTSIPSPAAYRYYRFDTLTNSGGTISIGKFLIGLFSPDLGIVHSGADIEVSTPQSVERTIGQDPVINYLGDDRRAWEVRFNKITATLLAQLLQVRQRRKSVVLLDEGDNVYEAIVTRLRHTQVWYSSGGGLFDAVLSMEQLG